MKVVKLNAVVKALKPLSKELRHAECLSEKTFTAGLIAFRPTKNIDPKQITHDDRDVVCQVLKGSGLLRINSGKGSKGKRTPLRAGVICHIPRGTPHDFAAARSGELLLFYLLIKTA